MKQDDLINDLIERTEALKKQAEILRSENENTLNARPQEGTWSILECLEHLNLYGDFYLPELEHRILNGRPRGKRERFKSGWFGEYTVTSMLPKKDKLAYKMNAFKNMTPKPSELSIATIDRFIKQQETMLRLLEKARNVDIQRTLTRITLPYMKFYMGTTFRFVIYHNERHLWQAQRAIKALKQS